MQRPGRRCNRVADTSKFPTKGRIDFDKTGREIAENPYISAPRLAIAGKQLPQPSAKTMRPSAPALLTRRVIRHVVLRPRLAPRSCTGACIPSAPRCREPSVSGTDHPCPGRGSTGAGKPRSGMFIAGEPSPRFGIRHATIERTSQCSTTGSSNLAGTSCARRLPQPRRRPHGRNAFRCHAGTRAEYRESPAHPAAGQRKAHATREVRKWTRALDAPQELRPVLELVVEDLRRVASGKPIQLDLPDQPAPSWIEPDAFAIVVRNLVENALKHGAPGKPVGIVLSVHRNAQCKESRTSDAGR